MSGLGLLSSRGKPPFSATNTHKLVMKGAVKKKEKKPTTTKNNCAATDLIVGVLEVDQDVQDLELSSDGVDHL